MAYTKTTWENGATALSADNMNKIEKGIEDAHAIIDALVNGIYPVGSILMTTENVNPSERTLLAGTTWVAWGSGRVPVGVDAGQSEFNTVGKTGGAKTHMLTASQMPSHTHRPGSYGSGTDSYVRFPSIRWDGGTAHSCLVKVSSDGTKRVPCIESAGFEGIIADSVTGSSGSGQAHNNLQPYITCYMWKRTA